MPDKIDFQPKNWSRRRFLAQTSSLIGLVATGSTTLIACGDNQNTALPTPAPTSIPTATATPVRTTAVVASTPTSVRATTAPAARTSPTAAPKLDASFVDAGPLDNFKATDVTPQRVSLEVSKTLNQSVFIIKNKAGAYLALSDICTHQGCEVDWSSSSHNFECPCHGSAFNSTGQNIAGPANRPLPSFTTSVQGERLFVSVKRK